MEKDDQSYGFMHPSLNPSKLKSVHRCARCGTVEERDNMTEDAMITDGPSMWSSSKLDLI